MNLEQQQTWEETRERLLREGSDPAFIAVCDRHVRRLDAKITTLKARQRANPMYWVLWFFGRVSKAH